jgi:hypothetical protein
MGEMNDLGFKTFANDVLAFLITCNWNAALLAAYQWEQV